MNLPTKRGNGLFTIFAGRLTSAAVVDVEHTYSQKGEHGHVVGKTLGATRVAGLVLSPSLCQYQLLVNFSVVTTFTGDSAVPNPGNRVTVEAATPRRPILASLKLRGSAEIPVYLGCDHSGLLPKATGCYSFGGGWREDFGTLALCHTAVPVNCVPSDDKVMGTAMFSWSLSPTY